MLLGIKEYEGESSSAESLDSLLCVAMISYELASDRSSLEPDINIVNSVKYYSWNSLVEYVLASTSLHALKLGLAR